MATHPMLLNTFSPEARRWHEWEKAFCLRCKGLHRELVRRTISTITWNCDTHFPPRRFINAHMRLTTETWQCTVCKQQDLTPLSGVVVDVEHIGSPDEIIELDARAAHQAPKRP